VLNAELIVPPLRTASAMQKSKFNNNLSESADSVASFSMKTREGQSSQDPYKINQDSFAGIRNFGNVKTMWIFGVFDGHGTNGHLASNFIKQHLPRNN